MAGWMGNYSERGKPAFRPGADPARLVTPADAFRPDSGGGGDVTSVTGDRHDVVAQNAPVWFAQTIAALSAAKAGTRVAARCIGSAGKYRFWALPEGVTTASQWQAVTAELEAVRFEATRPEREASLRSTLRGHSLRAQQMGMEVVEVAGQVDTWQSATTTAMHDDGRVVVISGGIDRMDTGNHVFPARVAGLRVTDMEEACTC